MSVRAYLMEINEIDSDKENYRKYEKYVKNQEYFNVWHQNKIFDIFVDFGFDGTNNDCVGQLELTDEQFENFMKENSIEKWTDNWTDYDLDILKKIKKYFDNGNWLLQLECY